MNRMELEGLREKLAIEYNELKYKWVKLDTFIRSDESDKLGFKEYRMLCKQRGIMYKYIKILKKRIDYITKEITKLHKKLGDSNDIKK